MNILNKLNFLLGIFSVIIFLLIAKFLEDLARYILSIIQNILYLISPYNTGGYLDLFYESLVMEFVGTAVYSGAAIFIPILLFKKLFKKLEIYWLPSIVLLFIFFSFWGIATFVSYISFLGDFVDTLQFIVMIIGYFAGYLFSIISAYNYVKKENQSGVNY